MIDVNLNSFLFFRSDGFVEKIHKLHCLGLHGIHDTVDPGHEIVICEKRYDTHHKTGDSSDKRLIYAA